MIDRPKNDEELQKREAIGVIRASRFIRKLVHVHKEISTDTLREIHSQIFQNVWPEIAGVYRIEDVKITDSKHRPPHYSQVPELMSQADEDLRKKVGELQHCEGIITDIENITEEEAMKCVDQVVRLAVWLHHLITFIHPFREGNGRTARLAANLILEKYGLVGISIKVEKENKERYRGALAQIDQYEDYEPLVGLVYEGLDERYGGVAMKYYDIKD